jgi:hypothetical protein
MSIELDMENAIKAKKCAELLLQDLQTLHWDGDALLSMIVLPEIEKVAGVRARLEALTSALSLQAK